jgi:hypothetical protein
MAASKERLVVNLEALVAVEAYASDLHAFVPVRGVTSTSACSNSSSAEQDQPPKASELWLLPP